MSLTKLPIIEEFNEQGELVYFIEIDTKDEKGIKIKRKLRFSKDLEVDQFLGTFERLMESSVNLEAKLDELEQAGKSKLKIGIFLLKNRAVLYDILQVIFGGKALDYKRMSPTQLISLIYTVFDENKDFFYEIKAQLEMMKEE